ncbi:hypothetical protein [Ruminococcus sp.]|uniref:hypothetical protein n=1 Tax=Ruminococcus sp. TaxID=41978 RepID=UPI0025E7607F|nr:hypothetical protein [Ruminococcus sp.]MCR4639728.1 hypothetical protein [Ruminococcus sp.]
MLFSAVCLVGAVLAVLSAVIWFKKKNIIEAVTMGVIMWFFTHIIASMALFVIDKYTIFRAGTGTAILCGAVLAAVLFLDKGKFFRRRHTLGHEFSIKDMLIPMIIAVLAIPFVSQKNYLFGMGQDQGVYQTQAILFMNGDTKRQKTITEYDGLETEREQEVFEYAVKSYLRGLDIPDESYPDTVYDRSQGPTSGIIHGIPTYSALLAMWGTNFGMENMQDFETLLYVCLIFLVYFICGNLKLKKTTAACACICAAAAPIVVWVAKAALTEMLLALIPLTFMYFMTDDENPDKKWLSIIPIVVFGCYHVSIYTMIPLFVMIYGGMYVFTREKQYAVLMPASVAVYLASYFAMRHVQPFYTMNNYKPVFVGGVSVHNITAVVTVVSAAAFAAVTVFALIVKKRTKKGFNQRRFIRDASDSKWFILMLRLLLILPCVYILVRAFFKYSSWDEMSLLALMGFFANAGIVLVPLGILFGIISVKRFAETSSKLVVFLMFFYCVLVYSAFLRYDIQYYYYYGRYLAPFVPVAVIFAAAALDHIGGKLIIPAAALGLLYVSRFDGYLMYNTDDSRMEWSILTDLTDYITDSDCVVISPNYTLRLWLPVRSMTGAAVFPEDIDDPQQFERLAQRYGRVIIITEKSLDKEDYSVMYTNKLHRIEDDLNHTDRIVPMSTYFWSTEEDISIYSYDKYRFMYTAAGDYTKMSGVSDLESFFCWTDSEEAQIECGLYPDDYDITMELGCGMPLEALGVDEVKVTMLLNGKEIGSDSVTNANNGGQLHFTADKELVKDGENILTIRCPLWSASVSNPVDDRELGLPVKSVRFSSAA